MTVSSGTCLGASETIAPIRRSRAFTHAVCVGLACGTLWLVVMGSTQATPAASRRHATTSASALAQRPDGAAASAGSVRVFSWNLSSDAFVTDPGTFRALVRQARADILLLDEVAPSTSAPQIRAALAGGPANDTDEWHVDFGASGGRQRGVIVSRLPLERLPEFADIVPYPETERRRLSERMAAAQAHPDHSMHGGIPVNGVVVRAGARRLLVLTTDLQCCGNDPSSWEEARRNVEAAELRRRVRQVLERIRIDGIIVAGDFNLVSTPTPLVILSGPYGPPHAGLIAAELTHLDGADRWTWDGSGTPFPSRPMDFVLYGPNALTLREGYVLDAADLPGAERDRLGLQPESANRLSAHRPLVAEFAWR